MEANENNLQDPTAENVTPRKGVVKRFFSWFGNWWMRLLLLFLFFIVIILTFRQISGIAINVFDVFHAGMMLLLLLAVNGILSIVDICKKRIKQGVIGLIAVMFLGMVTFVLSFEVLMLWEVEDHFADDLKLPEGIVLTEPLDSKSSASLSENGNIRKGGQPDIILCNGFQGGLYHADIWCNPGEPGLLYLKAFEITRETRLSERRMPKVKAGYSSDPGEMFLREIDFTIYEGNWGQYYGARFEVWFKPDSGQPNRKLFEKNFKIEGWMR